jgi:hypothetical protein
MIGGLNLESPRQHVRRPFSRSAVVRDRDTRNVGRAREFAHRPGGPMLAERSGVLSLAFGVCNSFSPATDPVEFFAQTALLVPQGHYILLPKLTMEKKPLSQACLIRQSVVYLRTSGLSANQKVL